MKLVTLFLFMAQSGPSYAIKQLPLMVVPEMTCHTALANNTIIKDTGVFYRGKQVPVFLYKKHLYLYC